MGGDSCKIYLKFYITLNFWSIDSATTGEGYKVRKDSLIMKRFVIEENGILYLVTNYRKVNGVVQISNGKFWKFPLKKKGTK